MSALQCNKERGFSLIEVVVAMFLATVGILAILSLQTPAWKTASKSDYLGRASGVLYKALEDQETLIMNPCNAVTPGTTGPVAVLVSRDGAASGDATYNVTTTIAAAGANAWLVTVTVTWPINTTGIRESLLVSRQELCRFPAGCADA
jgi:prepilin-type N-terminal cleavage/methylation domain-containing protein